MESQAQMTRRVGRLVPPELAKHRASETARSTEPGSVLVMRQPPAVAKSPPKTWIERQSRAGNVRCPGEIRRKRRRPTRPTHPAADPQATIAFPPNDARRRQANGGGAGRASGESRSCSRPGQDQGSRLSLRQPPARLFAMICLNISVRAAALIVSPSLMPTVRAVLLSCPAVMMPCGSDTIAPS